MATQDRKWKDNSRVHTNATSGENMELNHYDSPVKSVLRYHVMFPELSVVQDSPISDEEATIMARLLFSVIFRLCQEYNFSLTGFTASERLRCGISDGLITIRCEIRPKDAIVYRGGCSIANFDRNGASTTLRTDDLSGEIGCDANTKWHSQD